jgi:hypothetical protein
MSEPTEIEIQVIQLIRQLVAKRKHGMVAIHVVEGKPVLIKFEETTKL